MSLFDLTGRTALVTGSTRGLGLALARALADAGARIAVNGRSREAAERIAATFPHAVAAPFDVTDAAAATAGIHALGPVDVLVNNAGITLRRALVETTLDEWRNMLETNLTSAFIVARAVAPAMIDRRRGKIVNVGSVMSLVARETTGAYAAAKGGLGMLTRTMCAEWARHGIQANAIAPGYFRTDLTTPLAQNAEFTRWLERRVPAGRWAEPDELGGAVVFLSSPASDFVNGHMLVVDGGMTAVV